MAVYAYSVIAGTEKDEDEDSPTYGQTIAVYYEPGTDITGKFKKETLKHMLERGTASLYDPTKTPEEAAEQAAAEHEALTQQVESLTLQLKGAEQAAADAQAKDLAAAKLGEENKELSEEVAKLRRELKERQQKEAEEAAAKQKRDEEATQKQTEKPAENQ